MTISVVMSVYNGDRFLSLAVRSVLCQTFHDFEFIIVNDGSSDSSRRIIAEYAQTDSRIKCVDQQNSGIAASLNRAIKIASRELIAIMDADDVMMPNRLERQLAFLAANPEVGVACSHAYLIDVEGKIIGLSQNAVDVEGGRSKARPQLFCEIVHPSVLMRKGEIVRIGGYRTDIVFASAPDRDLWGRVVAADGTIRCQSEPLLKYRLHLGAISAQKMRRNVLCAAYTDANSARRLRGEPEITFESYVLGLKQRPLYRKLNSYRKDSALVHFKRATRYRGERMWAACAGSLAAAVALDPAPVLHRTWTKLRRSPPSTEFVTGDSAE